MSKYELYLSYYYHDYDLLNQERSLIIVMERVPRLTFIVLQINIVRQVLSTEKRKKWEYCFSINMKFNILFCMRITYETRPMLFSKNPIEPVPPKQTRYVGVLQHFLPSSKEGRMIPTNSEPFTYLEVSHFNMEA